MAQRYVCMLGLHKFCIYIFAAGRFREFYYWDTYWIVKALLHCDMSQVMMLTLVKLNDVVQ